MIAHQRSILEDAFGREAEPALKAQCIVHLHLHGSRVNGTAQAASDVDLAAEFDRSKAPGALQEIGLRNALAHLLGAEVDLSNTQALEAEVEGNFRREAELVF